MSNNGVSTNKAWIVCGLLLLATMINYMDRLTLNQTISRIMVDFDFQKDFYGKIKGKYNKKLDITQDFYGRQVAKGDQLLMMLNR